MNNEEKILEMLKRMDQRQLHTEEMLAKMDERQTRTEEMLGQMHADMVGMKADMADMKERLVKVEVTQENVIIPQIQALAEGQKTILETLAPKSKVEALEEEVKFLKNIIKLHTSQINDLRKAQ